MSGRIKGWCPSLLRPMQAADGWLVRLKPRYGRLTAEAAHAVADASRHFGNGRLELTRRGTLQLRGLGVDGLEPLAELAIALGLAVADPTLEARRNLLISPLAGDDPALAADPRPLADAIEAGLRTRPALASLPDKVGFLVDGGGLLPLDGQASDIALRLQSGRLELAGRVAWSLPASVDAAEAALSLAEALLRLSPERPRRMAALLERVAPTRLLAEAGLPTAYESLSSVLAKDPLPGFHRYRDSACGAFLAAWPFGSLTAEALARAAALATRRGDGSLRLTPWRALALPGPATEATEMARELAGMGALVTADTPLLRVSACPGQGACAEASVDTRGLARWIAQRLPEGVQAHVSGCAKGCAHPGPAALTLVGEAGRWSLVRNGRAGDTPLRRGLTSEAALEAARDG